MALHWAVPNCPSSALDTQSGGQYCKTNVNTTQSYFSHFNCNAVVFQQKSEKLQASIKKRQKGTTLEQYKGQKREGCLTLFCPYFSLLCPCLSHFYHWLSLFWPETVPVWTMLSCFQSLQPWGKIMLSLIPGSREYSLVQETASAAVGPIYYRRIANNLGFICWL